MNRERVPLLIKGKRAVQSDEEIKKAQRRGMFRVQIGIPVDVLKTNPENCLEATIVTCYTKDISGSGLAILNEKPLAEYEEYLYGNLHLTIKKEISIIPFKGKVVGVRKMDLNLYNTALKFMEMSERDQEKIVKFCMLKQVEQSHLQI